MGSSFLDDPKTFLPAAITAFPLFALGYLPHNYRRKTWYLLALGAPLDAMCFFSLSVSAQSFGSPIFFTSTYHRPPSLRSGQSPWGNHTWLVFLALPYHSEGEIIWAEGDFISDVSPLWGFSCSISARARFGFLQLGLYLVISAFPAGAHFLHHKRPVRKGANPTSH